MTLKFRFRSWEVYRSRVRPLGRAHVGWVVRPEWPGTALTIIGRGPATCNQRIVASGIADKLFFVGTDTIGSSTPILSGIAQLQNVPSGGFGMPSLNCGVTNTTNLGCVAQWQGATSGGFPNVAVALIT